MVTSRGLESDRTWDSVLAPQVPTVRPEQVIEPLRTPVPRFSHEEGRVFLPPVVKMNRDDTLKASALDQRKCSLCSRDDGLGGRNLGLGPDCSQAAT